ncbi:Sec-independent protein translocase family protein [Microbacterium gilvum]|uniref:Sec-independent protein translocase protein TatB n=1 Tax=Microbacterium gilvum TaxID=1336204 RepID=A0ABP9A283_9MICO
MFGLTFEKLLVLALIAAVIVGPSRLPQYAHRLAELIRSVRSFLDAARERTEAETGVSLEEWKQMDPRRYDPRRIVREALVAPAEVPREQAASTDVVSAADADGRPDAADAVPGSESPSVRTIRPERAREADGAAAAAEAEHDVSDGAPDVSGHDDATAPEQRRKWVVVGGSSGHPRRMLMDVAEDLAQDEEERAERDRAAVEAA